MRRGLAVIGVVAVVVSGCARESSESLLAGGPPGTSAPATTTATGGSDTAYTFEYLPLWPFAAQADADRWLAEDRPAGIDLWHADPRATALKFSREFLDFTDLDRTTTVTEQAREAWVGVGQANPNGEPVTVANLHLARLGPDAEAPWEVVGTEDTYLTIERPPYGSPVQPVTEVGGRISGVDESLRVQARQQSAGLVGEFCCVPAGGEQEPWSATLSIAATPPGAVTVVVSTGGHYAQIERFAITGLRAG